MDDTLLSLAVAVLTLVVAAMLFCLLRIAAILNAQDYLRSPAALPVCSRLPEISGRRLRDGEFLSGNFLAGQAAVLLFLSPDCADCRRRVDELAGIYEDIQHSGVQLWVISARSRERMRAFLGDSPLLDHVLLVSAAVRKALNPRNAAPFYLFIDSEGKVIASNFIGDDDWLSFIAQVRDRESGPLNT